MPPSGNIIPAPARVEREAELKHQSQAWQIPAYPYCKFSTFLETQAT